MKKQLSDEQIVERAKATFDNEAQSYDAATRSKLNQVRQSALAELDGAKSGNPLWLPAAGATACAVLVAVVLLNRNGVVPAETEVPGVATAEAVDFDILLAGESLEMLEDLEFYEVMELLTEIENGNGNIG